MFLTNGVIDKSNKIKETVLTNRLIDKSKNNKRKYKTKIKRYF